MRAGRSWCGCTRGAWSVSDDVVQAIVRRTDRVSAAFIKELMRRSVQFPLEREWRRLRRIADVENALDEMLFSGGSLNLKLLGAEGAGAGRKVQWRGRPSRSDEPHGPTVGIVGRERFGDEFASRSLEDFAGHVAGHVGQPEIAAGVAVGQLLVVQAHQGQQGGVEVGRVHPALDGVQCRTRRWRRRRSPS